MAFEGVRWLLVFVVLVEVVTVVGQRNWETAVARRENDDGCKDEFLDCPYFAFNNECRTNPRFMLTNCIKSCGMCTPSPDSTEMIEYKTDENIAHDSATNWEPRIVGGVPAYRGEFPDIVRIIYTDDEGNDRSICGGVIATWGRILTAAHCVYDDQRAYRYRVIAGSHRRDELNGAEQYRAVKRIWIPSTYNPVTKKDDYAYLYLNYDLYETQFVRLCRFGGRVYPGDRLTVAGWGTTSFGGQSSNVLLKAEVRAVSVDSCRAAYGYYAITPDMFCAAAAGKDSCQGDSGGPIYNKKKRVVGLVSFGFRCAYPGFPGVYQIVGWI